MVPLMGIATKLPQILQAADVGVKALEGANLATGIISQLKPDKPQDAQPVIAAAAGGSSKVSY